MPQIKITLDNPGETVATIGVDHATGQVTLAFNERLGYLRISPEKASELADAVGKQARAVARRRRVTA